VGHDWKRITVTEFEGGVRAVRLGELASLAALFGVPMVEFLRAPATVGVALRDDGRIVAGETLNKLLLGTDGRVGRGGPSWQAAAVVADGARERPAVALHRSRDSHQEGNN
jgi:hypothetical protein